MKFCGEIQYEMPELSIHSDICQHEDNPLSAEMREFLHNCLDEWLDKSEGTGYFWLGNWEEIVGQSEEEND